MTVIHRLDARWKLCFLLMWSIVLFMFQNLACVCVGLAINFLLVAVSKTQIKNVYSHLKPSVWMLVIIFASQWMFWGASAALIVILRVVVLMMMATILTLTTPLFDLVRSVEQILKPFSRWVAVEKIGLAIAVAMRFIPSLIQVSKEVREAQQVRGHGGNFFALAMPLIIRTLKIGREVADAVDARAP